MTAINDLPSRASARAPLFPQAYRTLAYRVCTYALLVVAVFFVLAPVYWMVITSLKLPREIYRVPALWLQVFTLENYRILLEDKDFLLPLRNSILVSSTVTVISVVTSAFAAFSMVRYRYRFAASSAS